MKKRSQGFRILFIGGIFFLLGTNFLAILFPAGNQSHKNYWYSSVGFELIPTTYADDDEDEDREDREERKREREDHEDEDKDEDRDREEHKDDEDDDEDDYYYIPPVSPAPTNPTTPTPTNPSTPTNPPSTTCRTVYDTVTSASGVKSQVPRQVCDTTTPTSPTTPEKTVTPTPVVPVPEKVTQKPVTPVTPPVTPTPTNPPSNNCRTLYETVYDTVTTASGTQKQEPRQVSRQVCDTTTPVAPVVTPEKVVTPPAPVVPAKPTPPATQKNPLAPITGIYTNGTYRGDGYYSYAGGSITYSVSLTLESSKIIEAHFIAFTPSGNGRYTRADGDAMLATLVRSQNASIDTVTGATGTSQAIQDAINIALRKARGENVTTPPPVVSTVLLVAPVPQSTVSPYVESTLIQSSDDVASGYISDALLAVTALPENQNSTETSTTSSDVNTVLSDVTIQDIPVSPGVQDGGDSVPTSRLIERIATKDGRTYSIIKDLESGKYILLDEKNGKGDPHTFQFKADAITYATTSEPVPQTFIERVFQFFASLFSGPSASPVMAESSIITKTQLLAQADVQTRTMERKILKQKIAEAIAQSEATAQLEIQNTQKPSVVPTSSVQKKFVPVVQKTAQITPKKTVAPVQKTVPKKSVVNTVTQAS